MSYVSGNTLIQHAWQHGYAIGAFSAHNAETIRAILLAAEEEQAPIMLQIGQKVISVMGLKPMKEMVDAFMHDITVPVCIHLDHSRSFEQTMAAVQAGFQSVMFDGSHLPFDENVRITRAAAGGALLDAQFTVCLPTTAPENNVRQVTLAAGSRIATEPDSTAGVCP